MTHVKYCWEIKIRTEKHLLCLVDTLGGSSLDEQVESEGSGVVWEGREWRQLFEAVWRGGERWESIQGTV